MSDAPDAHHSTCFEWPLVVIGDLGGRLKLGGKYINYPAYGKPGHRTIGSFYSTLLHAAGKPQDRFGALNADREDEMQFLDFTGMRFDVNLETKRAVAAAVAKIQPDIGFMLWPHDRHPDHEVASKLSTIALKQADRLFDEEIKFRAVRQAYWYDNGPGHTIDFVPNTFVDVSDEWPQGNGMAGATNGINAECQV